MIIPNILNIWASYSYDYQPQGRYSLPMLVALMYFVAIGIDKLISTVIRREKYRDIMKLILCIFIIFVYLICLRMFIIPMYL
jgi:succinate dehydrogenase hydrophobic anchor subunit